MGFRFFAGGFPNTNNRLLTTSSYNSNAHNYRHA